MVGMRTPHSFCCLVWKNLMQLQRCHNGSVYSNAKLLFSTGIWIKAWKTYTLCYATPTPCHHNLTPQLATHSLLILCISENHAYNPKASGFAEYLNIPYVMTHQHCSTCYIYHSSLSDGGIYSWISYKAEAAPPQRRDVNMK
jgi:hypothetical protein